MKSMGGLINGQTVQPLEEVKAKATNGSIFPPEVTT